jgi:hypothetical protein
MSRRTGRGRLHTRRPSFLLQYRKAPSTLVTLLPDVLFAYPAPEDVIVGEFSPLFADLGCATEGGCVEAAEDLEGDFTREYGKGIDANEMRELFGEERELREAAHGEDALKNQRTAWMRRRREI